MSKLGSYDPVPMVSPKALKAFSFINYEVVPTHSLSFIEPSPLFFFHFKDSNLALFFKVETPRNKNDLSSAAADITRTECSNNVINVRVVTSTKSNMSSGTKTAVLS